jgi:hypothetical protein
MSDFGVSNSDNLCTFGLLEGLLSHALMKVRDGTLVGKTAIAVLNIDFPHCQSHITRGI